MQKWLNIVGTQWGQFWWSSSAVTRLGPHIRDANSVQRVWNTFVFASLPAVLIGLWSLGHQANLALQALGPEAASGWRANWLLTLGLGLDPASLRDCFFHGLLYFLPVLLVALITASAWDALFALKRNRPPDPGLLYAAWFLALLMPPTAPLYQVALGMSFGIVVGKLIFGGSGRYLVNPALLGIGFLVFSYPALLFGEGAWVPVPGWDNPTVLELVTDEGGLPVVAAVGYDWQALFIGNKPGTVGTVSPLGALIGALILIWSGVASWRIMAGSAIGLALMVLVFNWLTPANPLFTIPWYWHFVLGGYVFATVFIATDPVTAPMTDAGRCGFGFLVGSLTALIRIGNPAYYEGILFAILLACLFSPLIDYFVVQRNIRRRRLRMQRSDHGR